MGFFIFSSIEYNLFPNQIYYENNQLIFTKLDYFGQV